jgi:type I restriction enzyme, S subunit
VTSVDPVRVGDVLRLERRRVDVEPSAVYEEIGVRSFGRGIFHKEPVEGITLGTKRVFRVEPGDLVISNVFAWEGAIAVAGEAEAGKIGSHRFMTFVPADGRIRTSWAMWFFRSEPGLTLIRKASPGSAGRNKTLAIKRFEDLLIPLPPTDVQVRQAAFLDDLSARATATADGLTARGVALAIDALPPIVDQLVRAHSCDGARLDELVELTSDIIHPGEDSGDANEFVGLQHVESHTGRGLGSDPIEGMKGRKFRFRPGDIVYGYLRPYLNKVWVADRHGLCSVDQYVLRPRDGTNARLLAHILRGRAVLDQAIELTHSLQLPRLRSGLLLSLAVPIVQRAEAPDLVHRLDRVRDLVVDLVARREHQRRTADALIPAALNSVFGPQ